MWPSSSSELNQDAAAEHTALESRPGPHSSQAQARHWVHHGGLAQSKHSCRSTPAAQSSLGPDPGRAADFGSPVMATECTTHGRAAACGSPVMARESSLSTSREGGRSGDPGSSTRTVVRVACRCRLTVSTVSRYSKCRRQVHWSLLHVPGLCSGKSDPSAMWGRSHPHIKRFIHAQRRLVPALKLRVVQQPLTPLRVL